MPINLYFLLFLEDGHQTESLLMELLKKHTHWNEDQIKLFAFSFEHIFIMFIVVLEMIIPDVPNFIRDEQRNKGNSIKHALQKMTTYKKSGKHNDEVDDLEAKFVQSHKELKGDNDRDEYKLQKSHVIYYAREQLKR